MNFLDKLKGYRTLIVQAVTIGASIAIALGVLPAAKLAGVTSDSVAATFDQVLGAVGVVYGLVNAALRLFTTTPAGAATHPAEDALAAAKAV